MKLLSLYFAVSLVALIMGMLSAFCLATVRMQMNEPRDRRLYTFLLCILPSLFIVGTTILFLVQYPSHQGVVGGIIGCYVGGSAGLQGMFWKKLKKLNES